MSLESPSPRRTFPVVMRILVILFAVGVGMPVLASAQVELDRVVTHVRRDHDVEALRALDRLTPADRRTPRVRYLEARLLDRQGRFTEAASLYPTDADSLPPPVQRDARRRAAVAFVQSGACARALPLLEGDDNPLSQARRAECTLANGDFADAVAQYRAVVRRDHASVDLFAARFGLAEALTRSGDRAEAVEVLTALIVERAEHPEVARAEAALTELLGHAPTLSFEREMDRVDRLMEVRRYRDALARLDDIPRPARGPARVRYLHTHGMALFRERHHYAEAAEVLTESAALRGAHAGEDEFHAARAMSRDDRDAEAVRAYRAFARRNPRHARTGEALYLAAWLDLRLGTRGAAGRMDRFLRSRHGRGRFAREARWQLAMADFVEGRHARAETRFEAYASLSADTLVRARGLYWRARAREARGARTAALAAYREVLYVEPLHWYALLARQRIEAMDETAPPPFPDGPEPGASPTAEPELPASVRFYADLGLLRDARAALRGQERSFRREAGPEGLVHAYTRLASPNRLVRLFGGPATTRRQQTPGPADRWRWDAAYPRPWEPEVREAAQAAGLEPAHLYAIMRQESGYDPSAVSYADAIGLLQLLPSTAERVAQRLGQPVSRAQLFLPEVNVRLGAAYVGTLEDDLGIPLAFAGFNGGEHNVHRWLTASGRTELDLFVEQIPFVQTRNYIRRVTTHYAHYRYLEDPDGGWPITLPTHVEP
ncbi:MAG: transglycosylase SLT domain-containing protein [Sandaracinaceae bacterium]